MDLKTEALSCRKICSLKDATHISGLYSDVDMLPPSLDGTQLTIRPGTDFTSSSQVSLDQEPVTNVEATILPGDAETTANPVTGWVHALTGRYQAPLSKPAWTPLLCLPQAALSPKPLQKTPPPLMAFSPSPTIPRF